MRAMIETIRLAAILVAMLMGAGASAAAEQTVSIYVVYQSKSKDLSAVVIEQASQYGKVKKYNADLLTLADYTGKQRVVSKLKQSTYIVLVGENTADIFGEALVGETVIKIDNEAQAAALAFEPDKADGDSPRRE